MICVGSIAREDAADIFPFLAEKFRGRRNAIKEFTHRDPDFVFWIYPNGDVHDARDSHLKNVPRGYKHILHDEPDYGGFLRGRVASHFEHELIVVYCREEALFSQPEKIAQFLRGLENLPVFIDDNALVISDNGDIYGTVEDVRLRSLE